MLFRKMYGANLFFLPTWHWLLNRNLRSEKNIKVAGNKRFAISEGISALGKTNLISYIPPKGWEGFWLEVAKWSGNFSIWHSFVFFLCSCPGQLNRWPCQSVKMVSDIFSFRVFKAPQSNLRVEWYHDMFKLLRLPLMCMLIYKHTWVPCPFVQFVIFSSSVKQ